MNYEGQICRPPMERASYMLPVAVGCSYNACTFCGLFKHLKYRELPKEQIEQEMIRVHEAGGNPKTIFLGDGNAFGLDTRHLLWILERTHHYFPGCEAVNMDATVTNISEKSDEELQALYDAGVRNLYLGIESGLDDVLSFMKKDHTLEQAYTQIARIQKVGMIFNAHMMTGIAGKGRGMENAQATAEFFNRTKPHKVINFSVFHHKRSPLYRDIEAGRYTPADEQENLREEHRFMELIEVEGMVYDAFHDVLETRFRGTFPKDREKMLSQVDQAIAYWETQPGVLKFFP
ncbi:MAG: radical SAM protein [Oscillospiraceae bacterium]|nr:radical SAM protein [Oscillospiraceae bacterium]